MSDTKNRVVVIGDITNGFRIHGLFSDNAEAFAYVKRHDRRFRIQEWKDNAHAIMVVNLDTMTEDEVIEYEGEVAGDWAAAFEIA